MKIFGQPADYSEILQRIFWCSIFTGLFCTFMLANASPTVHEFIKSIKLKTDLGPIKGIEVLYVLIPGVIVVVARMIKLHDRISDLFRIRFIFDTRCLLFPLCRGSGATLTDVRKATICKKRIDAMYQTVYKYAGFKKPDIDDQLVRTAADNWGWFWGLVESSFLVLITVIIFACMQNWNYMKLFLLLFLMEIVLMLIQGIACIRSAKPQVNAILSDPERKYAIWEYFNSL